VNDDYLWDGSGKPDPEIRRLESLLGRFRHDPVRTSLDAGQTARAARRPAGGRWVLLATAATLVIAVVGAYLVSRVGDQGWEVVRLEGAPRVGSAAIARTGRLSVGGWVVTDEGSRAEIRIGTIGEARIDPGTRVRLVRADLTDHRLLLERGTLHARIWAPPRLFFVETPSATVVDLGCTYTLSVDAAGESLLSVTSGWVAFEFEGRESFVPAGALCATRKPRGPGTPYFEDATPSLRDALRRLDFEDDPDSRASSLEVVLREARPEDALSLWHLLSRMGAAERGRIHDRLAVLVPPPVGVTRDGVLRGDREMLDRWWDALGLGVSSWWRLWKSPGPPG